MVFFIHTQLRCTVNHTSDSITFILFNFQVQTFALDKIESHISADIKSFNYQTRVCNVLLSTVLLKYQLLTPSITVISSPSKPEVLINTLKSPKRVQAASYAYVSTPHTIRHTQPVRILWMIDQLVAETATYMKHNKHERIFMRSRGFEPAIPTIKRLQTYALDQCFSTAGPRPGTGPWRKLYRAARGSPGV